VQKEQLELELEAVGIRLNTAPPDVVFKQKTAGGVSIAPGQELLLRPY
jgi:ribosome-interacting GTPase 1